MYMFKPHFACVNFRHLRGPLPLFFAVFLTVFCADASALPVPLSCLDAPGFPDLRGGWFWAVGRAHWGFWVSPSCRDGLVRKMLLAAGSCSHGQAAPPPWEAVLLCPDLQAVNPAGRAPPRAVTVPSSREKMCGFFFPKKFPFAH